jgi:transposase-like protein/transposase Tn5 family protein
MASIKWYMTTASLTTWAEHELRHADLPDARLNKRLARLVADLSARPAASVPEAAVDWAPTKAAYRFFDNDRVEADAIRRPHCRATLERLPTDGPLLAIQDTTELDFTPHPATRGLGYLGHPKHFGLLLHSVLLASADGVPLGLLHQQAWTRDPRYLGKRKDRRKKETADKESQRWLTALRQTEQALPAGRTVLTIADREADFYDLFAAPRAEGRHLLIRAKGRRSVRHEARLLGAAVQTQPVAGRRTVTLPRGDNRPARTATLAIRFGCFEVNPPSTHPRRKELAPLRLWAVLVEEEGGPAGQPPIRWLLLTTAATTTREQAWEAVRFYTYRWLVERFHFALKSGCKVEELQLGTVQRLQRAVATYSIVAWRLLWLTYEARRQPQASCEAVFSRPEWQVLHRKANPKVVLPQQPPTLREAVRQVARLGGFLARRQDGEPGVKTLWRGLRRLQDLLDGYELGREQQNAPRKDDTYG